MSTTKIIIADDHTLFADGLEQIVQSLEQFEVIAKVTDGKTLLQKLNTVTPDIILMDINMPWLNGMEAAEKIIQLFPQIKIIFISMYSNVQLVEQAKKIGARGFIMKNITAPELKETIINIKNGALIYTGLPAIPNNAAPQTDDPFLLQYKLTPKEVQIIKLIKEGNATKQIAGLLELSTYTIETHRKNINRKLNVRSTAELIAITHKFSI
ncbi:response regulator [Niabella sp. 22666]|uniref:response regulator n=1 Tax=Niabella sp. 22666 TaxID=3453954 RepID=UPI003F86F018